MHQLAVDVFSMHLRKPSISYENLRKPSISYEYLRNAPTEQLARIMPDGRTLSEVIADHRVLHVYPAKLMVDVPTGVQSAGELSCFTITLSTFMPVYKSKDIQQLFWSNHT
jgi:hypothetical protein